MKIFQTSFLSPFCWSIFFPTVSCKTLYFEIDISCAINIFFFSAMFLFVAHENKGKGKEINFLKELDLCNFAADLLLRKKNKKYKPTDLLQVWNIRVSVQANYVPLEPWLNKCLVATPKNVYGHCLLIAFSFHHMTNS